MENKTIHESLQEYLKNTPKEKVIEDWNEFQHLDNEGITINDFLENQKKIDEKGRPLTYWGELEELRQETLEEVAEKLTNDFPVLEVRFNLTNEEIYGWFLEALQKGAKWQQKQDKNLYSEEDLLKFGAFVRIEDKKEKRLFLIQDYYKKWFEQFSKLKNG